MPLSLQIIFVYLVLFHLCPNWGFCYPCNSVNQFEITFTFSESRECGKYVNGDYWVLADVSSGDLTITSITPQLILDYDTDGQPNMNCNDTFDFDHECDDYCAIVAPSAESAYCSGGVGGQCYCTNTIRHGYEVNPVYQGGQAFDSRVGNVDPSRLPNLGILPLTVGPGSSVVKGLSVNPGSDSCGSVADRECLLTAAVLTVVAEVPPTDAFRPPYTYSEDKTLASDHVRYSELNLMGSDGMTPLLPNLTASWVREQLIPEYREIPTYNSSIESVNRLQLDHKGSRTGRAIHPTENIPDYGASIASRNNDILLLLSLEASEVEKKSLLIPFIQYGIDLFYVIKNNGSWTSGGGHRPGQKIPLVFAAYVVDKPGWRDVVQSHSDFNEEWVRVEGQSEVIWGYDASEERYWNYIATEYSSNLEFADPYRWIDGGMNAGHIPCGYQTCCTTMPWKGSSLVVLLIPELREIWNDEEVMMYIDRYVRAGIHTLPDPCAGYDGQGETNLGITFGPDPDNAGDCIRWTSSTPVERQGRFPEIHGEYVNEGGYNSRFQWWMWEAYRSMGVICRYHQGTYNRETRSCDCEPGWTGPECAEEAPKVVAIIVGTVLGVLGALLLVVLIVVVLIVGLCCSRRDSKGSSAELKTVGK